MGFGEAAKAALSKAVEALQAIAEVRAIVQQLQIGSANFERRVEARIDSLEARIRELERENAKLQGQVQGAYADALKTVFWDKSRGRSNDGGLTDTTDGRGSLTDASVHQK